MQVIPVIDILNGIVVHAQSGQRDKYSAVQSQLSPHHDLASIAQAFINFNLFKRIYIADLDAILQQGNNFKLIFDIANQHNDINFLLDAGSYIFHQLNKLRLPSNIKLVYGSENALGLNNYSLLFKQNIVNFLSLDFKNNQLQGDEFLLEHTELWPEDIILMSLDHVGNTGGPSLNLFKQYKNKFENKNVFLAGGVRHLKDLHTLQEHNIAGVLVASCLHQETLTKEDLENIKIERQK